ncbi:MAG: hypothetical protein GXP62_20905 [Oligoflexia bacterium]|nr:hypothetical protein [Oligoflexia bacterium]
MVVSTGIVALVALLSIGCKNTNKPLAKMDDRYVDILVDLGISNRDTTRNVHSKEARHRKAQAEERRVAFFHDKTVQAAIDATRADPPTPIAKAKADGYWRDMIVSRPWTEDEKDEEVRLLGRLEEQASVAGTWTSADKTLEIPLSGGWTEVSRDADTLDQTQRDALAAAYVEQRMQVAGEDLKSLVKLRNEVAKREGFATWWELGLASEGLSPADIDDMVKSLTEIVQPHLVAVSTRLAELAKRRKLPLSFANLPLLRRAAGLELGREVADTYFDADLAEDRVLSAFHDMGVDTFGWQVYTEPARYARPGVYGFPIRPPEHLAIVVSQDRRWSTWQYEALAHEGGHAAWWGMLSPVQASSPTLWGPRDPWFEGFAQFFERMVFEPAFTSAYVPDLPADLREKLAVWRAGRATMAISDAIVATLVEKRLYETPDDLLAVTAYAASVRASLTGQPTPPGTSDGLTYDPVLLSSIMWNYPAYSQNFMVAGLVEAWLYAAVTEQVGDPIGNPKVGPLLKEKIVRADPSIPFPDRIAALTKLDRKTALAQYLDRWTLPDAPEEKSGAKP